VFGLQSVINMGVNLQLMPAKGMTLPFISYGGSSLIAIAISMGMVLALTRQRPEKRAPDHGASRPCRRHVLSRGPVPRVLSVQGTGCTDHQ
jgi:cell division protein FtsW